MRYLVTTRRELIRQGGEPTTALAAVGSFPGVSVVAHADPNTVTIDTDAETAERLRNALSATHFVEPEIRRGLH